MSRSRDVKGGEYENRRHIDPEQSQRGRKTDRKCAYACMGVSPEGAVLARGVDRDDIVKCLTGGDATMRGVR